MKLRPIFLFFLLTLFPVNVSSVYGQAMLILPEISISDSIGESILQELKTIRGFQEESNQRRAKAVEERHKRDSLHNKGASEDLSTDYSVMSKIEDNTRQKPLKDGWNLFGYVTFLIALLSLIVGFITYEAQKKTEHHTTNAPLDVQRWILKDLPRHFYRNLVCTFAIIRKNRNEGLQKAKQYYPSESNFMKLQTLPDDIVLPIDIDKKKNAENNPFKYMHEIKLLLRNYNTEVKVASEHISRKTISDTSLIQDFDNLIFKPFFLIESTFKLESNLPKNKEQNLVYRTIISIIHEHFNKIRLASNFNLLLSPNASNSLRQMFDNLGNGFEETIDTKRGLDRSIDLLLKYGIEEEKKDDNKKNGIKIEEKPEKKYRAILTKNIIIIEIAKKEPDFSNFCTAITSIRNKESFVGFFYKFYSNQTDISEKQKTELEHLYDCMRPYFDYLLCETWEFHLLMRYLLAIDSTIEMDRIGMVNFD